MEKLIQRFEHIDMTSATPMRRFHELLAEECKTVCFEFAKFKHDERWQYYQGCWYEYDIAKLECNGNFYTEDQLFNIFIDEYYGKVK